jgi:PAS domain S-box-containing protein
MMERPRELGVLLEQTQDKIALIDESGDYVYANQAAEPILGFSPAELVGENAFDYIHPDDVAAARQTFHETIEQSVFTEATAKYRHRAADGSWVWLESRMSNLTDDDLDGYVVSSRDITDVVEAERERDRTADRLQEIAAVSGDVLWMFDGDWSELLFVNPAFEDLYGISADSIDADATAFLDAIHPDDRPAVEDAMGRLSDGNPVDIEYRVNPREDYDRWVWVQAEPIEIDGEVVRITGFTRDITDRRRREQQLYVMDHLLRHNLRNDLNVILGRAELIEEQAPEVADETTIIRQTSRDLLQTAQKQRDIIDLVTDQQRREPVRLDTAIRESVASVRERYPDATVEVGILDAVTVRGRPELELAATELLENAIQHSDTDDPTVRIRLRRSAYHAELVVEDESTPIPPAEAAVLTGDHDMNQVYHSSGLGFWLVYWCVELSNGHVAVHSESGRGNRITATLPRDTP